MFSDVFEKLVAARGRLDRESGAKAVKLSGSRFSHVFRQRTGMSWRAAETAIRLELSAHTVVLTDWRLSEIAHLFEYSELKSWSESFDKHFGLRPRDYRRLCAYLLPRGLPGCRYVISQHLGR
jgi:transcriptional regulator GlxA family with amidase domain